MKTISLILVLTTTTAFSQGSLTPPGIPAPTMKSLQEIWDKLNTQQAQITSLQTQLAAVSGLNAISAAGLALPWQLSSVESSGSSYFSSISLAFGPNGQPAISYHETYEYEDEDINSIKLAQFSGSSWTSATRASDIGLMIGNTSLAFGPDGQAMISYYRFFSNGIVTSGTPSHSIFSTGLYSSLAFDPNGKPAIAYMSNDGNLMLSRYDGNSWSSLTITPISPGISSVSLSFSPDGQPALSYVENAGNIVNFAKFDGSNWTISTISTAVSSSSLAFGPDGQPAISFVDSSSLKIARYNGSGWITSTVDTIGSSGPSLAFGLDGQPTIAYGCTGGVKFARFNGSAWISSIVDTAGYGDVSLAFGPDGQPAIAYIAGGYLKFARKGVFMAAP